MPFDERLSNSTFSHCNKEVRFHLILAAKVFESEVDQSLSNLFSRPPQTGLRGHAYRIQQAPSRLRRRGGVFLCVLRKYIYIQIYPNKVYGLGRSQRGTNNHNVNRKWNTEES